MAVDRVEVRITDERLAIRARLNPMRHATPATPRARALERVREITFQVLGDRDVRVRSSDIDGAIDPLRAVPSALLAGLRERLEESEVPYNVDVVDLPLPALIQGTQLPIRAHLRAQRRLVSGAAASLAEIARAAQMRLYEPAHDPDVGLEKPRSPYRRLRHVPRERLAADFRRAIDWKLDDPLDETQEKDAYALGAAILSPRDPLAERIQRGESAELIAQHFGVSHQLVEYRIKVTGAWYECQLLQHVKTKL